VQAEYEDRRSVAELIPDILRELDKTKEDLHNQQVLHLSTDFLEVVLKRAK